MSSMADQCQYPDPDFCHGGPGDDDDDHGRIDHNNDSYFDEILGPSSVSVSNFETFIEEDTIEESVFSEVEVDANHYSQHINKCIVCTNWTDSTNHQLNNNNSNSNSGATPSSSPNLLSFASTVTSEELLLNLCLVLKIPPVVCIGLNNLSTLPTVTSLYCISCLECILNSCKLIQDINKLEMNLDGLRNCLKDKLVNSYNNCLLQTSTPNNASATSSASSTVGNYFTCGQGDDLSHQIRKAFVESWTCQVSIQTLPEPEPEPEPQPDSQSTSPDTSNSFVKMSLFLESQVSSLLQIQSSETSTSTLISGTGSTKSDSQVVISSNEIQEIIGVGENVNFDNNVTNTTINQKKNGENETLLDLELEPEPKPEPEETVSVNSNSRSNRSKIETRNTRRAQKLQKNNSENKQSQNRSQSTGDGLLLKLAPTKKKTRAGKLIVGPGRMSRKEKGILRIWKTKADGTKFPFSCSTCGKGYHLEHYLRSHEKFHRGEMNFPCGECDQVFASKISLGRHQTRTHIFPSTNVYNAKRILQSFTCGYCGTEYSRNNYLARKNPTQSRTRNRNRTRKGAHADSADNTKSNKNLIVKCDVAGCGREFSNFTHFHWHHGKTCPSKPKPVKLLQIESENEPNQQHDQNLNEIKIEGLENSDVSTISKMKIAKANALNSKIKKKTISVSRRSQSQSQRKKSSINSMSGDNQNQNQNQTSPASRHNCGTCGKGYTHEARLQAHEKLHTLGKLNHPCAKCHKVFISERSLEFHEGTVHKTPDITNHVNAKDRIFDKSFKCVHCGKEYFKNSFLITSPTLISETSTSASTSASTSSSTSSGPSSGPAELSITCDIFGCTKTFSNFIYFSRHHDKTCSAKSSSNLVGSFQCQLCLKCYSSSKNLERHTISFHTKQYEFFCDQCGIGLVDRSALKSHMFCHTTEKQFTCRLCPKSYKRKQMLTMHMREHKNHYPYMCTHCGKRFVQVQQLKKHEATHISVKEFPCHICNKMFKSKSYVANHVYATHNQMRKRNSRLEVELLEVEGDVEFYQVSQQEDLEDDGAMVFEGHS